MCCNTLCRWFSTCLPAITISTHWPFSFAIFGPFTICLAFKPVCSIPGSIVTFTKSLSQCTTTIKWVTLALCLCTGICNMCPVYLNTTVVKCPNAWLSNVSEAFHKVLTDNEHWLAFSAGQSSFPMASESNGSKFQRWHDLNSLVSLAPPLLWCYSTWLNCWCPSRVSIKFRTAARPCNAFGGLQITLVPQDLTS